MDPIREDSNQNPGPQEKSSQPNFLKKEEWDNLTTGKVRLVDYYKSINATDDQKKALSDFIRAKQEFKEQAAPVEQTTEGATSDDSKENQTQTQTSLDESSAEDKSKEKPYYGKDGVRYPSYKVYRDSVNKEYAHKQEMDRLQKELADSTKRFGTLEQQLTQIKKTSKEEVIDPATSTHNSVLQQALEANKEAEAARTLELQRLLAQYHDTATYSEIENFQGSFPEEFKTSVPFRELNDELIDFQLAIGGKANVERFFADKAFREQMEAQGFNLSQNFWDNEKVFDKIIKIHQLKNGKPNEGIPSYPNLRSAYLDHTYSSGRFQQDLAKAKLDGKNEVIDKLSANKKIIPTLPPGAGASATPESQVLTKKGYKDLMDAWKGKIGIPVAVKDQLKKYKLAALEGKLK